MVLEIMFSQFSYSLKIVSRNTLSVTHSDTASYSSNFHTKVSLNSSMLYNTLFRKSVFFIIQPDGTANYRFTTMFVEQPLAKAMYLLIKSSQHKTIQIFNDIMLREILYSISFHHMQYFIQKR